MSERIDPDYDSEEAEVERVSRLFALMARRVGSLHVVEESNGSGFHKWILGVTLMLFVAGVSALAAVEYSVVQRLSILETKVDILLVRK